MLAGWRKRMVSAGFLILTVLFLLLGCSGGEESTAPSDNGEQGDQGEQAEVSMVLKLGHVSAPDLPYDIASKEFAKEVEERTNGKIKIEVYGSGQLGGDRDMIEQVQLGTLDLYAGSTASLTNFVPEFEVMDLPFLFNDHDHVYRALDGEVGQFLAEKLEGAGFKHLGYWEQGFKNISNNVREVRSAADMAGIRMRIQESPLLAETYKALGADTTPIAFPEVYTSIQQGVVDGYEGSIVPFSDIKLYEVQNYLSEARISFGAAVLIMNKEKFESLDEETQQIFIELGEKYALEERKVNQEFIDELMDLVAQEGVQIVPYEELDIQSFKEAVAPVYDKYPQYRELVEKIRALE